MKLFDKLHNKKLQKVKKFRSYEILLVKDIRKSGYLHLFQSISLTLSVKLNIIENNESSGFEVAIHFDYVAT